MIHLSQHSAFSRVLPSSAVSSVSATPSSTGSSAPATPLTTYATHASAMPIFSVMNGFPFAMNPFPLTYPSAFQLTLGQMFPYSIPTFLPTTFPTAFLPVPSTTLVLPVASSSPASGTSSSSSSSTVVLPAPPITPALPAASSSPASGVSSSSSPTALSDGLKQLSQPLSSLLRGRSGRYSEVFNAQEDDLLLQIYIERDESESWMEKAQKAFAHRNLSNKQIKDRIYRLKSQKGLSKFDTARLDVTTKSIITHARHALQVKKGKGCKATAKCWTDSDKAQFSEIYKNRASYEKQGTNWQSVAKQTLNRTDNAISHQLRKMRHENSSS